MQYPMFKKCISQPPNCLTYKSVDSLIQVCNLVYALLTPSLITQVLRYHIFFKIYCTLGSESVIYGEVLVSVLVILVAVI